MKKKLTCIICPIGCDIEVTMEDNKVTEITGNSCSRGEAYARTECINPMRTLTTTVRCDSGVMLPVRTETTIPKAKMMDSMAQVNQITVSLPISVGDVIMEDLFGSQVIATRSIKAAETTPK